MKERFYNQRNLTRKLIQLLVLFALLFIPIGTWARDMVLRVTDVIVYDDQDPDASITGSSISGTVKYDPNTMTLTLEDAKLSKSIIFYVSGTLTIELIGNNSITGQNPIDDSEAPCIIGLANNNTPQEIAFTKAVNTDYDCDLALENSWEYNVISGFTNDANLTLNFLRMVSEQAVQYQPRKASIEPVYFTIAGHDVSKSNANDIKGEDISGTRVSFDKQNKILTLENATITGEVDWSMLAPQGMNENLTVKLVGSNTFNCISNMKAFVTELSIQLLFTTTASDVGSLTMISDSYTTTNESFLDNYCQGFINSVCTDGSYLSISSPVGHPETVIVSFPYNISVAGTDVTSANASNVFGDAGTAKVSYAYDDTNDKGTLSLNGAELTGNIIWNNNYDLYIALTGTNSIIHANDSSTIIRSEKSYARLFFTKTGDASLELQHKDEGTSAPSIISGFRDIDYTTNGLYITSDIPTKYASKTIVTNHTLPSLVGLLNDNCIHAATITSIESYPLWIAGTQITAANNASTGITGTGISGTVTYEPNNNKLTLSSATIEYETGTAIVWTDPTNALTVYLIGNNTIDSRDNKTGQIAFQGNGSDLNFNTGSSPGSLLLMSNKNPYGIADFDAGFYHVDFGALSFDNLTSGNWTESQISYHYPLIIANKQVTSANYNTIRSGTVTFDPTTTTLTLHGNGDFDLTGGDDSPYTAVESGFDNLNVYLEGATSILCRGTNDVAFKGTVSGAKVTFTTNASSPGSLFVAASATKMFTDITPEYDGLMYFDTGTRDYLNQVKNENVTLSTGKIMKAPWEGSGTTGDPFLIKTVDDLKNLAAQVGIASNKVFKLNNNISLSGVDDFEPIGEYSGSPFKGTFDGGGNTISGLIYKDTGNMYAAGLFAYVGDANTAGTIKNLVLENCSFSGGNGNIGAVVGSLVNGTIDNCTVTSCTITRADVMNINAGGIAGSITTGTVKNCTVDGTTTITAEADDKGTAYAGAIYGSASGAAAAPTLTNNYYYYTVQTSTKVGSADAEVKSSNEERGIGDDDDADGAKLYTKALTVQGLSDGDEYVFKEFYNKTTVNYYYAPGTIVSLEIYPKEAYALTSVSLTAGSQTDNLDNTSTTGYTYQFTMPDADGTINVTSAINLASTNITCEIGAANYDGTAQVPTTVNATGIPGTTGATELTKDTHFTIKGYKLNGEPVTSPIDAGNYTVTIEGKGDYTGSKDVSYTINKASLANAAITKLTVGTTNYTGDNIEIEYTGEAIHPTVTVTINDGTITVDPSEYTVSYGDNNTNVNGVDEWASVKVTSTGKNFTAGTYTAKDFKIVAATAIIRGNNETVTYNGAAQAYSQGTIDKGTLVVTYFTSEDNRTNDTNGTTDAPTNANTYYVLLTQGNTNYTADPKNATFTINPKTLTDDMVTLSPESFEYNGAIQKPEVTVADGTALTGDDYTIENNGGKDVDTYNVVVTAKRNYTGKVTKTFKITNRKLKATDVTFNAHWASFYHSTEDIDLPEGIAAYVVTSVGETTATATQISYIPAGVPVLLQDEVTTTTTNTSADGNMMAHTTDDVTVASLGGTIYGLYNGKLMRVASGTIPAGKNYIKVSQPNAARQLSIVIGEGGATAIQTLEMDEENDTDEWFTLDGRKLQRKPAKNGLYLQNGKKVVINNK